MVGAWKEGKSAEKGGAQHEGVVAAVTGGAGGTEGQRGKTK